MNDWTKDLSRLFETAIAEAEDSLNEVANEAADAIAEWVEAADAAAREFQTQLDRDWGEAAEAIAADLDRWLGEWFEAGATLFSDGFWDDWEGVDGFGDGSNDAWIDELSPRVEPTGDRLPACRGCRHYHGRIYGGRLLVCGMHPYGWEGESCPDWEGGADAEREPGDR